MTLVIEVQKKNNSSASARRLVEITADNAYANPGGYAVEAADFELGTLDALVFAGASPGGFLATYDPATGKVVCFKVGADGPLTECADNEATLDGEVFVAYAEGDQVNDG